MEEFKIVTDTTADLPKSYLEEHKIGCMFVSYTIDGTCYQEENAMDAGEFYEQMRAGIMPTTSQINPAEFRDYFTGFLKENKNILYLAFSSGLSGTYNNARMAAEELMEEQPDCKIIVIDTKCASLGEGLLVHKAVGLRAAGKSMEETAKWVEEHLLNLVHIVTVDDLNHLHRGGRVSKTAAVLGTLAGVKPLIHVDEEGHLIPIDKVRGRKKALHALVDYMEAHMGSLREENDIVFISHADAREEAEAVQAEVKERFGIQSFLINTIGPTIGTHTGTGTVALFFMGEKR